MPRNIESFGHNIPFGLETSLGLVAGYRTVNKFGETINADSGTKTDVYDESVTVPIWTPPTQARTHQISSTSTDDDFVTGGGSSGTGAKTIRIYGFKTWDDLSETSEVIIMDGTGDVATVNEYVVIFRMKALTWGSGGVNAGKITATADTDGTITASILATQNQTQMAIFAATSNQQLRITLAYASIVKGTGSSQRADGELLVMIDPETNVIDNTAWINKENFLLAEGNLPWQHDYRNIPKKINGPCIVKIQVTSNSNNTKCIAGFDGFIYEIERT